MLRSLVATMALLVLVPASAQVGITGLPASSDPNIRREQQLREAWNLCQPHSNMRTATVPRDGWEEGWHDVCEATKTELKKVDAARRAKQGENAAADKAKVQELLNSAKQ